MKTYCLANFKGGVSKTTTAVNLAAIWADRGDSVLLIDADPQHNASSFFGCENAVPTLTDVLEGEPLTPDLFQPVRPRLWMLPADLGLLGLDLAAMQGQGGKMVQRLRDLLEAIAQDGEIDRVVIDCPPSFTAASVAALSVADEVILPTTADAWAVAGVEEMLRQIRTIRHCRCRVLITMAARTRICEETAGLLRERFDCLAAEIRRCVKVPESGYARQPLFEYAPRCSAALDYQALASEIGEMTDGEGARENG